MITKGLVHKASVKAFEPLARAIWERLRDAHILGISQREETITETLLLDIRRAMEEAKGKLWVFKVEKTTPNQEAVWGCDWLWEIRGVMAGGIPLRLRFVVQAKKLDTNGMTYSEIKRPVKTPAGIRPQYELLREHAEKIDALALYAFFNSYVPRKGTDRSARRHATKKPESRHFHCVHQTAPNDIELMQMGCTLLRAARLEKIMGTSQHKTFKLLHDGAGGMKPIPMRCLFHADCLFDLLVGWEKKRFHGEYHTIDGRPSVPRGISVEDDAADDWLDGIPLDNPVGTINLDRLPQEISPVISEYVEGNNKPVEYRIHPRFICVLDLSGMGWVDPREMADETGTEQ
jgi:hypothetical protein